MLWTTIPSIIIEYIPRGFYSLVFYFGIYSLLVKLFVWSLPPNNEDEDLTDESSSSEENSENEEHPIYLLIKRLLEADGIDQDRLSDARIKEMCNKYVEEFDKIIETTDDTFQQVEQYLMKIKPLVVAIIKELKEPDGELEVEKVSNALPLANKPSDGVKYEKLEDLAAPTQPEGSVGKDYNHLIGKRYIEALEEVAKDGYTLKITYIGDLGFKWESAKNTNMVPVWIEDSEFDYYTGNPSELAVIKDIKW